MFYIPKEQEKCYCLEYYSTTYSIIPMHPLQGSPKKYAHVTRNTCPVYKNRVQQEKMKHKNLCFFHNVEILPWLV